MSSLAAIVPFPRRRSPEWRSAGKRLYFGIVWQISGCEWMLDPLASVRRHGHRFVAIVGGRPQRPSCKSEAEAMGLAEGRLRARSRLRI